MARKRKSGDRHPCGKRKQPSVAARAESIVSVVLAQPHRRGNTDQRAEGAWGRFCLRARLAREVYDAGEEYASVKRRWRAAKGVPSTIRLGIGGSGDGPSEATVMGWGRMLIRVEDGMARVNLAGYLAIRSAVFDQIDIGGEYESAAVVVAEWLAGALGRDVGKNVDGDAKRGLTRARARA